jgi:membrane protein YqaA with SNARE-associated domain
MVVNLLIDAIGRFANQRRAQALVAGWALAEAMFLPVVPDVALLLLVLAAPRRSVVLYVSLICGSLVGTLLLWLIFSTDPTIAQRLVLAVSGASQYQLSQTVADFISGSPLRFAVIGSGTPLKVLSLAWLEAGRWALELPFWVILNRLTRIGPLLVLFALAGARAPGWLRRHDQLAVAAYVAFWLGVYVLGRLDLLPRE